MSKRSRSLQITAVAAALVSVLALSPAASARSLDGSTNKSYGNGTLAVGFHDGWTGLCIVCVKQTFLIGGSSYSTWTGSQPKSRADKITQDDRFKFSGLSLSLSVPAGASLSPSGDAIINTKTVKDKYQLTYSYTGVKATSLAFTSYSHNVGTTFKFGTDFQGVTAYNEINCLVSSC